MNDNDNAFSGTSDSENNRAINSIIKLAMPMTFGMLIHGLYALVDAYFIMEYAGEVAFAAVSSVFPLQIIMLALGLMVSNGCSILVSRQLGGNTDNLVGSTIASAFWNNCVIWLLFGLLALLFAGELFSLLAIPAGLHLDASRYFLTIVGGSIFLFSLSLISDVIRSFQNMEGLLAVVLVGAIANIVLDYFFLAWFQLGVYGAAFATLLSQVIALSLGLILVKKELKFPVTFKLNFSLCRDIALTGFPVVINYVGAAIVLLVCNYCIASYGNEEAELTLVAYGIVGRINTFIILPLIAISMGCQTLIAQAFGGGNARLVFQYYKSGMVVAAIYLFTIWLLINLAPMTILSLFSDSEEVTLVGKSILQTTMLMLPVAAVSIVTVALLQATGKSVRASILASAKLFLLIVPTVLLLSTQGYAEFMWYGFPFAELVVVILIVTSWWFMSFKPMLQEKV